MIEIDGWDVDVEWRVTEYKFRFLKKSKWMSFVYEIKLEWMGYLTA